MAAALAGCATTTTGPPPGPPDAEAGRALTEAAAPAPAAKPVGAGSGIDDLVAYALSANPGVRAAEAKVRRLRAKVPQAEALPDPRLKLAAGSMAETAAGRVDLMTGVEQAVPFPGKRRELAGAAARDAEAAVAQLEAARLTVAAAVKQAYWNYFLAARTTQITRENGEVLDLIRESINARVAANLGSQDDQLRLSTEAGKLDQALVESKLAEAKARARLNALLDRPAGSALPAPVFRDPGGRGDLAALIAQAESQHPEVVAARAQVDSYQHRLAGAKLDRFPDFVFGLNHAAVADGGLAMSANGRDQFYGTFGVSLPVWRAPRDAKIAEAVAGIEEATANVGAARAGLRADVEDAWLRVGSAKELIELFDRQILPEAQQAFDGTLTAYAAGKQSFVGTLDAWRQLLGLQVQQAGNRAQLGMAMAALDRAAGRID